MFKASDVKELYKVWKDIYNLEYNNYYNNLKYQDDMKQQELENQRAEQERQDKLQQQAWENAFKEKQYADSLAQQQFENQLAQKEYELKVKQVNASITATHTTNKKVKNEQETEDPVVNTNYCLYLNSKSKKAQSEYNALLTTIMKQGGIKTSILNEYLAQGQSEGIFTKADVSKIKEQFGIK